MDVYLSPLAEKKLELLLDFLEEEWGQTARSKFLNNLEREFSLLSTHPFRCKRTKAFPKLHNCIVTRQTSAIYRILESRGEIEIITFFDNRQDPQKLIREIKKHFG